MPFIEVNDNPLQRGGLRPELLREVHLPERGHSMDTRLVLDADTLAALLDVAEASPTGRAVIHHATVVVRLWKDPSGHTFETYGFTGSKPVPERLALPTGHAVGRKGASHG